MTRPGFLIYRKSRSSARSRAARPVSTGPGTHLSSSEVTCLRQAPAFGREDDTRPLVGRCPSGQASGFISASGKVGEHRFRTETQATSHRKARLLGSGGDEGPLSGAPETHILIDVPARDKLKWRDHGLRARFRFAEQRTSVQSLFGKISVFHDGDFGLQHHTDQWC